MATINWSDLMAAAEAEGFTNELLPDGPQEVQVASVKVGNSKGGKPQIGVRLVIQNGPLQGKGVWDNLTVTAENPKAMAVFFRKCYAYGATKAQFDAGQGLEEIANSFVGSSGVAVIGHHEANNVTYQDITSFKQTGGVQAAATAPAPGPNVASGVASFPAPGGLSAAAVPGTPSF